MASIPTRKEPTLEEQQDAGDEAPLLLTHLLREGLPPQLWRHTDNEAPEAETHPIETRIETSPEHPPTIPPESVVIADHAATFSMHWEEAAPESLSGAATVRAGYAQADPRWLDTATVAPRPTVNEAIEEHELDATPTPSPIPETAEMQARATDTVAPAVPTPPVDLDFLKDFEDLLFQEIERRIINEMEDLVTQHLQTVWKERISLTIMRTLALEGIQLRESLAGDIRKSLPEILQRVLHEGLDQITPSEIEH